VTAPLVVFAVGNPSRGDDAIGPLLLERLSVWLAAEGLAGGCELVEDFQLQIEHSLDLLGRQLALFIDAGSGTPAPYTFQRIAQVVADLSHTTHALEPGAVLEVYARVEGKPPPPAFVLCVRGECFELGTALSPAAESHAAAAFDLLKELCRRPDAVSWAALAETTPPAPAPDLPRA
jgi:hydrogenase maturation protease